MGKFIILQFRIYGHVFIWATMEWTDEVGKFNNFTWIVYFTKWNTRHFFAAECVGVLVDFKKQIMPFSKSDFYIHNMPVLK